MPRDCSPTAERMASAPAGRSRCPAAPESTPRTAPLLHPTWLPPPPQAPTIHRAAPNKKDFNIFCATVSTPRPRPTPTAADPTGKSYPPRRMRPGSAPSAIRTPISCRRAFTICVISPYSPTPASSIAAIPDPRHPSAPGRPPSARSTSTAAWATAPPKTTRARSRCPTADTTGSPEIHPRRAPRTPGPASSHPSHTRRDRDTQAHSVRPLSYRPARR